MSDLDAFELKVRRNIKLLSSDDPKARREAAAWLGEAGDPSAITRLRQLYEEDPDRQVRQTAAYALGMFRALETGLNGPKQEEVVQRLEDVALKGKFGRRTRIPVSALIKLVVALLTSLAILLAFNFLIWPLLRDQIGGTAEVASVDSEAALRAQIDDLRADVEALRAQYQSVFGGAVVDCGISFNDPAPLAAGGPPLAAELNTALADFQTAKMPYDQACADGTQADLTAADVAAQLGGLSVLLDQLAGIENRARGQPAPQPDTPPASPPPGEAEAPAAEPEATAEPPTPTPNLRPAAVALLDLIDDMQTPRGPAALLNRYWEDIRDTGSTDGCGQPVPAVPADYALSPELAAASNQLELAAQLVNTGLGLTRQGWAQFTAACASANPREAVETGLGSARNASASFNLAREQINTLLGS